MIRLPQNELALLLDCIREIHSHRDQASLVSWLLDTALPELIPSDWLSYNEVDLRHPEKTIAILKPEENTIFQGLFPRFQEVAHQHPLIVRQLQANDFPVHKISDFLTQEAFHQLDLYRDVYQPMGVEYQIAATIRLDPDHVTAFALSRQQKDYTERDRTLLELLRPHLVVALNNLALTRAHQTLLDGHELALNELSSATIIVDSHGHILYHTGAGLLWLGAASPGSLPAQVSDWLNQRPANGSREILRLISHAGEIHLRALPTKSPERRLLVLTRKNGPLLSVPPIANEGLGRLSQREWEVAGWIREGKTNAEIAAIMGISPRTVHKHVEHIFEKMGVENRTALARQLGD